MASYQFGVIRSPLGARLNPMHPLAGRLQSMWLFNEGVGQGGVIQDLAGNSHIRPVFSTMESVTARTGSPTGGAIYMDGINDYYTIDGLGLNALERRMTHVVLIKRGRTGSVGTGDRLFITNLQNGGGWGTYFDASNYFRINNIGGAGADAAMSLPVADTSDWYMLGITWDGGRGGISVQFYMNGYPDGGGWKAYNPQPQTVQAYQISKTNSSQYFKGWIAAAWFWRDRCLSDAEHRQLAAQPLSMLNVKPVRFYLSGLTFAKYPFFCFRPRL